MKRLIPLWLVGLVLLPAAGYAGAGIETQVSTGIFYYPADAEKRVRAATERAEDGLEFRAAIDPKDLARDTADDEMRHGNVCLRQLRTGLKASVKKWHVRELCERIFQGPLETALRDAAREKLHPDHLECTAEVVAREKEGSLGIVLAFRGELVMRDRTPAKLRRAGIGGDLTRWELTGQADNLGAAADWKDALKSGACSADAKALEGFWVRLQKKAAEARELAECRNGLGREDAEIGRLQAQLRDYVPEEWIRETAGDDYKALMEPPLADDSGALKDCHVARESADHQLDRLRTVSSRIADKHDVSALNQDHSPGRSPASETEEEGD